MDFFFSSGDIYGAAVTWEGNSEKRSAFSCSCVAFLGWQTRDSKMPFLLLHLPNVPGWLVCFLPQAPNPWMKKRTQYTVPFMWSTSNEHQSRLNCEPCTSKPWEPFTGLGSDEGSKGDSCEQQKDKSLLDIMPMSTFYCMTFKIRLTNPPTFSSSSFPFPFPSIPPLLSMEVK